MILIVLIIFGLFLPTFILYQTDIIFITIAAYSVILYGTRIKFILIALWFLLFLTIRFSIQISYPDTQYISLSMLRDARLILMLIVGGYLIKSVVIRKNLDLILRIFVLASFALFCLWKVDTSLYTEFLNFFWGGRERLISSVVSSDRFSVIFGLPFTGGIISSMLLVYFLLQQRSPSTLIYLIMISMVGWSTDSATFRYGVIIFVLLGNFCRLDFQYFRFRFNKIVELILISLGSLWLFFYNFLPIFGGRFTDGSKILVFLTSHLRFDHFFLGVYDIPASISFLFDFGILNRFAVGGILYSIFYYFTCLMILKACGMPKRLIFCVFSFLICCEIGGSAFSQPFGSLMLVCIFVAMGSKTTDANYTR